MGIRTLNTQHSTPNTQWRPFGLAQGRELERCMLSVACCVFVPVLLLASGCVTQPDREAIVGGAKVLQDRGEKGDAEAGAAAEALWQTAADVGAVTITDQGQIVPDRVDPATVETTVPASKARAEAIARARATRGRVAVFIGGFLAEAAKQVPWGGTAATALAALWALYRNRRIKSAASAAVGTLNGFKHLAEKFNDAMGKPDEETNWGALLTESAGLLDTLKGAGKEGSAAWAELSQIHAALKAKG